MRPLYTFYGDDFTGSTDVLEQLASKGVRAALFFGLPTPDQIASFGNLQAFGVAGDSRSRSPAWMTENLPAIFSGLGRWGAPVVHYKTCSTFDSSPTHGSIGRAIELGMASLHPHFVPLVVGAPHLRRFVLDGKLFASAPDGRVHRIDRHPMSRHPVTPMREPDLRRHLGAQTGLSVGLVSHEDTDPQQIDAAIRCQLAAGYRVLLFDTTTAVALDAIGGALWREARVHTLFAVGSSGVTAALIRAWEQEGEIGAQPKIETVGSAGPLLVVSGSCSVATARQIEWALSHGYAGLALDPAQLLDWERGPALRAAVVVQALHLLADGRHTVLYTAIGQATASGAGERLGVLLGQLLREVIARSQVRRVVICGGDTSSHAVGQLGLYALTWLANLQTGAPLCRAHATPHGASAGMNGLELVLKGGQVGTPDFFDWARGIRPDAC